MARKTHRPRLGDITGEDTLKIRQALGLTQREFAGRLKLFSDIPVNRWENVDENGKRRAQPAIYLHERLRKLAAEAEIVLACDE